MKSGKRFYNYDSRSYDEVMQVIDGEVLDILHVGNGK